MGSSEQSIRSLGSAKSVEALRDYQIVLPLVKGGGKKQRRGKIGENGKVQKEAAIKGKKPKLPLPK